ncbi:hypothetical protein D0869_01437 [Hortaea werneckii]|uniref:Major facilitator superfamily (MFS) profile domain-containing protein n=1 Tax=Hortaea werneckii TaxID=91943 RepID=A0A3M6XDB9_HORWE|nr:hypothetical protein D0869_01437 [Hortaea werneckii]
MLLRSRDHDNLTFTQKIGELDLVSNCLFIPSLTALFLALSWAGVKYPWSDGKVIGLLVTCAVLLVAFLFNQYRRGDSAALPFRIITNRNVISGFIFTTCTNSVTNVFEWYLPTFYQVVQGRTPRESGYLMVPILVGMMLGLILQGFGTTSVGYYAPFMLFASVCMPIAAGLMTTYDTHTTLAYIIFYSGFVGFGGGIGFQGPQAAVQTTLSEADVNLGIGVILFGQSMGPAIFIATAQVIFANELSSNLGAVIPTLTPSYIERHGLGSLRNLLPLERQNEVLEGFATSLTHTWFLPLGLACTTMIGSILIEWRSRLLPWLALYVYAWDQAQVVVRAIHDKEEDFDMDDDIDIDFQQFMDAASRTDLYALAAYRVYQQIRDARAAQPEVNPDTLPTWPEHLSPDQRFRLSFRMLRYLIKLRKGRRLLGRKRTPANEHGLRALNAEVQAFLRRQPTFPAAVDRMIQDDLRQSVPRVTDSNNNDESSNASGADDDED